MDQMTALWGLDACIGWLGALALLIVGLTVVRGASTQAGLMVAGAGVLKIFVNCCAFWPTAYMQMGEYDETVAELFTPSVMVATFLRFLVYALVAGAVFALAKQAAKPAAAAPGGAQSWNG